MNQLINPNDQQSLKAYFTKIRELVKSGEQFPSNLEEVWPLVYASKQNAIRELKTNFIDGDDFHLIQNDEVLKFNELQNGVKYECKMSVPCLEYFIVRKVRPVFDVYRSVFHSTLDKAENPDPTTEIDILLKQVQILAAQNKRITAVESEQVEQRNDIEELKAITTTRPDYYAISGYARKHKKPVDKIIGAQLGKKATAICNQRGFVIGKVNDEKYGDVGSYPADVLKEVFDEYFGK